MDERAELQNETGSQIEQVVTNYKKDGPARKTIPYYIERLRRLEELWDQFESTDTEIREKYANQLAHPYYVSRYYDAVKKVYLQYLKEFSDNIERLKNSENWQPSKDQQKVPTARQAENDEEEKASSTSSRLDIANDCVRRIRRQQSIISSLYRALQKIQEDGQPRQYYEIQQTNICRYWAQIEEIHNSIGESTDDLKNIEYDIDQYIQLEGEVHQALVFLGEILARGLAPQQSNEPTHSKLNLPKIVLPRFDGDYLKWSQFHDLFTQMVDKQPMSTCEKMYYLKTNLSGEAERVIRHVALSDSNYASAWKLLKDRYNNTRLLVSALINRLLSQPSHASEATSAATIKSLHDTTQECLHGLESLGIVIDNWDPLLLHILLKKLDRTTHTLYEQSLTNPRELQPLKNFLKFLETRFQSLEALGSRNPRIDDNMKRRPLNRATISVATDTHNCSMCKRSHQLFSCSEFLRLSLSDRVNHLKQNKLCINCLKGGHFASNCSLRGCTKCTKKHNTLVHFPKAEDDSRPKPTTATTTALCHQNSPNKSNPVRQASSGSTIPQDNSSLAAVSNNEKKGYVFLSTVVVNLVSNDGTNVKCRAILDSGSQVNIITERMMRKLEIPLKYSPMELQGIGESKRNTHSRANVNLISKATDFSTRIEAIVLPQIVSPQPTQFVDVSGWKLPNNIKLADPQFNVPNRIDMLIGAEYFHQLLCIGQIKMGTDLPLLQNTLLGWIVTGKTVGESSSAATCAVYTDDESLERTIGKFWETEELPNSNSKYTLAEQKCEELFNHTIKRDSTGRFIVSLPFSDDPEKLGASMDVALSRFYALERKLAQNAGLREQYVEFMNEYINLGHMEEIDYNSLGTPHYFLPHHSVLKPDSSTTKLRVVFDASSKTSSNVSLNDIMHAGPTIQDELFTILLRFRLPKFVIKADIQKMYRQIRVREEDKRYQLIWWRSDSTQPLKCYQLCTVTYGTTAAPYLATRCLQKLAQDHVNKYPLGSQVLQRDFYVDDAMTGANSLTTAKDIQAQLSALLREGGFNLRKWCSNNQQLLANVPPEDQEIPLDDGNHEGSIKTLGLIWLPNSDLFCIKTNCIPQKRFTKRSVASDIARIFDPLGIVAPVVIVAKLFLQELWELKYDWDAALPVEMYTRWCKYRDGLQELDKFRIPRHVFAQCVPSSIQMHTFADASAKAYGAAVYIRSINKDGTIIVRLLCSKSRVAPVTKTASGIKSMTIPRLELCAALLAAEISRRVKTDLNIDETSSFLWTDSQIVLSWINSNADSFHTFVGRRIANIQRLTDSIQWRHVRTHDNPADVLSRGISPEKLQDHNLWIYGPRFLHGKESIWPPQYKNNSPCEEERKKVTSLAVTECPGTFIEHISHSNSFSKLQRVTAYCLRVIGLVKSGQYFKKVSTIRKTRQQSTKNIWTLSVQELEDALQLIVKNIQDHEFKADILRLKTHKDLDKKSPLLGLAAFLDHSELLRVGGRLQASDMAYDAKHPMLLPYSHPVVKLLMTDIHVENLHVGPQGLLAITRQRFWPIKGKNIARSIVQQCTRCIKAKPKMYSQMMGNLPLHRVQPARPFINCGVDFCGPIWIHYRTRGSRPQKSYLSIFCCFSTKAVHIEVVSDLSTDAFIGALKRFIGRRGHCKNLYCDNATNFVGARNQLSELEKTIYSHQAQSKISSTCISRGIEFHFIPPRAPHFGGLWEAAVKSAKYLLQRKLASASLTYEELCTVSVDIEAILNSRPLTPVSSDPNDLTALTPGHFLIGEPLKAVVDPHSQPLRGSLSTRWKLVSHLKEEFWNRWSREYLNELQHRTKWKTQSTNIQLDTVVIIKEDNTPVMKWPLGRIIKLYYGNDGCIRVADVRTKSGVLRRPIHKLAPLIKDDSSEEEAIPSPDSKTAVSRSDRKRRHVNTINSDQPSTSSATSEAPRKQEKRQASSLALVGLLLIGLLLPLAAANEVEITKFNASQPGLHFEKQGQVNFIHNRWNLVVYYKLEPYRREFEALENSTMILDHLCSQLVVKSLCTQVAQQIKFINQELTEENAVLTPNHSSRKVKRGALDVVGNVANSLFGLLDSRYAEEMSENIERIHSNENHLTTLLRNNTSILDSTVNIMRQSEANMAKRHNVLVTQLREITNRINNITDEVYQIKVQQLFSSWSIYTTLLITNIQRTQASIADVLSDTHQGRISHLLMSPQQLQSEIIKIKNHLPLGLRLPVVPENMIQLYKLMSTEGRITTNHVLFKIDIPLIGSDEFAVFKILPVPAVINNALIAIEPSSTFLAVSAHHDQYYPISESELSSCDTIEGTYYLCTPYHPIYRSGANISTCEWNFLNTISSLSECTLKTIEANSIWTKLPRINQWIYAVNKETLLKAVCSHHTSLITIVGSGFLKLQPNCVVTQDHLTLRAHYTFVSNARVSYTRLSQDVNLTNVARIAAIRYDAPNISTHGIELQNLRAQIRSQQLELPNQIHHHNIRNTILSSSALLLVTAVIIFMVWKYRSVICRRGSTKPVPSPRTAHSSSYTINV